MDARSTDRVNTFGRKVDLIFQACDVQAVLDKVLAMEPAAIIDVITASDLRGRGGAGFPTGLKWRFAASTASERKFVICNADEGEPGTFKDREILQRVPEKVFTGMLICARAIGAGEGCIYLRGEYVYLLPDLLAQMERFNAGLRQRGIGFAVTVTCGSGAYVCGEETSLLESMEGKRGEPRNKPPYPTVSGFLGQPTVVNNVETLVYSVMILRDGPEEFRSMGTRLSRGAKVFCVSGDCPRPGIYELELGMTIRAFVDLFGDGDCKAVQVGGSSGFCVPRKTFDETVIGFEGVPTGGAMMLFNSSRSMYHVLKNYLEFFCEESCGQCTPCRVGCQQLLKGIDAVKRGEKDSAYLDGLASLAQTMRRAAKCGLGQSVANPFVSITANFREEILY